jgi:hypothetical protein
MTRTTQTHPPRLGALTRPPPPVHRTDACAATVHGVHGCDRSPMTHPPSVPFTRSRPATSLRNRTPPTHGGHAEPADANGSTHPPLRQAQQTPVPSPPLPTSGRLLLSRMRPPRPTGRHPPPARRGRRRICLSASGSVLRISRRRSPLRCRRCSSVSSRFCMAPRRNRIWIEPARGCQTTAPPGTGPSRPLGEHHLDRVAAEAAQPLHEIGQDQEPGPGPRPRVMARLDEDPVHKSPTSVGLTGQPETDGAETASRQLRGSDTVVADPGVRSISPQSRAG